MTTYSTSLKLELPGDGQQSGTWGQTTNKNFGTLVEQAITGVRDITMLDADYVLTSLNGTSDEARNAVLVVAGTNSATRQVVCPLVEKVYIVKNATTGGQDITIGASTGLLVTVQNGVTQIVYCDGINFYNVVNPNYITGNLSITGALTVVGAISGAAVSGTTGTFSGAVTGLSFAGAGTGLTGTAASLSIGGNAATATNATNATTAANANAINNGAGWNVYPSGTKLCFSYGGILVASIDQNGNFIAKSNVSAYGTP